MAMNHDATPEDVRTIRDFYEAPTPEIRGRAYDKLRQRMNGPDAAVFGEIHRQVRDRLADEHKRRNPPQKNVWIPSLGRTQSVRA